MLALPKGHRIKVIVALHEELWEVLQGILVLKNRRGSIFGTVQVVNLEHSERLLEQFIVLLYFQRVSQRDFAKLLDDFCGSTSSLILCRADLGV